MLLEMLAATLSASRRRWFLGAAALAVFCVFLSVLVNTSSWQAASSESFLVTLGRMLGQPVQAGLPVSWLNVAGFLFLFPSVMTIFAIHAGSFLLAADEENGSMGLLLSYPLRRSYYFLANYAALVIQLAALGLLGWMVVGLAGSIFDWGIPPGRLVLAWLNTTLLGLCFGTLAFGIGSVSGKSRLSFWIGILLVMLTYCIFRLPELNPSLTPLAFLSPFTPAFSASLSFGELFIGQVGYLLLYIMFPLAGGWFVFSRRDLGG
jgi:ABC-2 type transport system permease protein